MGNDISKVAQSKVSNALNLLSQANNAMIEAILQAVKDSDTNSIDYEVTIVESCGYTETRTIKSDEDGNIAVFDEDDNECIHVEDMSADDLFEICAQLN